MSDDEPSETSRPEPLAERLLEIATNRAEERMRLIERWARAEHWTVLEGISLAWTLDPAELGTTEFLRKRPETALPEEARHYLDEARLSSAFENGQARPSKFIQWAHSRGLAFHPDWTDSVNHASAAKALPEETQARRKRQLLIGRWAYSPYWTPEEGAALAFNLNPKDGTRRSATGYDDPALGAPPEAKHLLVLARRAIEIDALEENASPIKFMTWARTVRVEFHPDWWDAVASEEAPAEPPTPATPIPELKTKERESLLKLVIGMAMAGYKWDPKMARNSATAEIAGDLDRLGVGLDQDTILKWLRAAAEHLPQESR